MRTIALLGIAALSLVLAGCSGTGNIGEDLVQSSVFAQPSVVYHTGDNVEVSYYLGGIQRAFNERNAMELLKKECNGPFRIANRSSTTDGESYVDAICVH